MESIMDAAWQQALESTRRLNELEDKIAQEMFGCSYDELDYDNKDIVTFEAYDRFNE